MSLDSDSFAANVMNMILRNHLYVTVKYYLCQDVYQFSPVSPIATESGPPEAVWSVSLAWLCDVRSGPVQTPILGAASMWRGVCGSHGEKRGWDIMVSCLHGYLYCNNKEETLFKVNKCVFYCAFFPVPFKVRRSCREKGRGWRPLLSSKWKKNGWRRLKKAV